MSTITFEHKPERNGVLVKLDGKIVGSIRNVNGAFQYTPKGQKQGGECFSTLDACKASLTSDE